ncbi:MAG: glycosyltransferase [Bacilli bacterium]|nr:glycosyltransferase [Bacilli bacterium]
MKKITNLMDAKISQIVLDRNSYKVKTYGKGDGKLIVFPIFHYQGDSQYFDLISPLVDKGYKVITCNFLNIGDKVLTFNYYYSLLIQFIKLLEADKKIKWKNVTVMGFGIGANLASYLNKTSLDIARLILISPINKFKSDYSISKEVANYKIPTYIFYGQFDSNTSVDTRFQIYSKGKNNPKVQFFCYPRKEHFLYYGDSVSFELEDFYKNNDYNVLRGEDSKRIHSIFLPTNPELNEEFFTHLFNILNSRPNKKRICLLSDSFPYYINGVQIVVDLLRKELDKLGYETYVACLWKRGLDFTNLNPRYIPLVCEYAHLIRGHRQMMLLQVEDSSQEAKMLAMFDFKYLHLHTEYTMSQVALELSKITGVKCLYTYHTLWKYYYKIRFGKFLGDITYKMAKKLMFNKVFKECPTIIVPSYKTYNFLKRECKQQKDIRIYPSPIDIETFQISKDDQIEIDHLKKKYHLSGKKVIGFVGRVSGEKNIVETLNYMSKIINELPKLVFMIVGTGDESEKLKHVVSRLKLDEHVIFVGQVPNKQLKLYYRLFDAFVTASNFETQGLTYFEAAASGTVIVAREDEAIQNIFFDKVNAYIYKDFLGWTERIEKALYGNNKDIIKAAKKTLRDNSQEKWAKEMVKIYQEINE